MDGPTTRSCHSGGRERGTRTRAARKAEPPTANQKLCLPETATPIATIERDEVVDDGERHREAARPRVHEAELVEDPAEHRHGRDQERSRRDEEERRAAHVAGDVLREQ
jgi:hypothetical protein